MVVIGGSRTSRSSRSRASIQAELERAGLAVLFDDRVVRPGCEVRRRRADRLSRAGDGRKAHRDRGIGRRSGSPRARPASGSGRRCGGRRASSPRRRRSIRAGVLMAKTRIGYQECSVRPRARGVDGSGGRVVPASGRDDRALGRLPEPPRPRQPAAAGRSGDRADRAAPWRCRPTGSWSTGSGGSARRCTAIRAGRTGSTGSCVANARGGGSRGWCRRRACAPGSRAAAAGTR